VTFDGSGYALGASDTREKDEKDQSAMRKVTFNVGHSSIPLMRAAKPRLSFLLRDRSLHAINAPK
jgi:hypothetical protein